MNYAVGATTLAAKVLKQLMSHTTICSVNNFAAVPLGDSTKELKFVLSVKVLLQPSHVIILLNEMPMILLCFNYFV